MVLNAVAVELYHLLEFLSFPVVYILKWRESLRDILESDGIV